MNDRIEAYLQASDDIAREGSFRDADVLRQIPAESVEVRGLICGLTRYMIEESGLLGHEAARAHLFANSIDPMTHDEIGKRVNVEAFVNRFKYVDPFEHQKRKAQSPEAQHRRNKRGKK